jgi:hypothetical protein
VGAFKTLSTPSVPVRHERGSARDNLGLDPLRHLGGKQDPRAGAIDSGAGRAKNGPMLGARWAGVASLLLAAAAGAEERATVRLIPCMGGVVFVGDDGRGLSRALPDGSVHELVKVGGDPARGFSLGARGFACSRDGADLAALTQPRAGDPVRLFVASAAGVREYQAPAGTRFSGGLVVAAERILAVVGGARGLGFASIDRASGAAEVLFEYHGDPPLTLAATPDGHLRAVWSGAGGAVLAESALTPGAPRVLGKLGAVREAALSPDGAALVWLPEAKAPAQPVRAWWIGDGEPLALFPAQAGGWSRLEWSADGKRAAARGFGAGSPARETVHVAEGRHELAGAAPLPDELAQPTLDPALTRAAALPRTRAAWLDVLALPGAARLARLETGHPNLPSEDELVFSHDGARLYFTRTTQKPLGARAYRELADLYTVEAAGGAPRKLARMFERDVHVAE